MKKATLGLIILLVSLSFTAIEIQKPKAVNHSERKTITKDSLASDTINLNSDTININEENQNTDNNNSKEEELTHKGLVSWYGGKFNGRLTSSGERYNMNELTAAHKTLPFGTKVKLRNPKNGKEVIVRVTDRGPYVGKRVFDLSKAAFSELSDPHNGVLKVTYEILD